MKHEYMKAIGKVHCNEVQCGTAFLISSKYAVTAFHVIESHLEDGDEIGLDFPLFTSENLRKANLVKTVSSESDLELDVAILELQEPVFGVAPLQLAAVLPAEGFDLNKLDWESYGYPMTKEERGQLFLGRVAQINMKASSNEYDVELFCSEPVITDTRFVSQGASGSPIFVDGYVFGVMTNVNPGGTIGVFSVFKCQSLLKGLGIEISQLDTDWLQETFYTKPLSNSSQELQKQPNISTQWFMNQVNEQIPNAGARYTPEFNVDLPIAQIFDGLGHTKEFFIRIKKEYGKFKRSFSNINSKKIPEKAKKDFERLVEKVEKIFWYLSKIESNSPDLIPFKDIDQLSHDAWELTSKCIRKIRDVDDEEKSERKVNNYHEDSYNSLIHYLSEASRHLDQLIEFTNSTEAKLANIPALLLVGEAGTGKTHLFCDIAKHRVENGLPTVLLFGQQFDHGNSWEQIIKHLGSSCTRDEFLNMLETYAEKKQAKALILIDALNEGHGKELWKSQIAGMLEVLSRYKWIGIAVSIRSSYENTVIPDNLVSDNRIVREEHRGFADHEYQATRTFFDHFGIERPSVPMLVQDFQNPLFLKLFCKGLKNKGYTRVPTGLQGITSVFDFFINSVNDKLCETVFPASYNKLKFVQKAVKKMAELMARNREQWLEIDEAFFAVREVNEDLFDHLINEGIISEDRFWNDSKGEWVDTIRFSYERFTDHLIAKFLLDQYLDKNDPLESFQNGKPLAMYFTNTWALWENQGLIEAFSVQIPEKIGMELYELVPSFKDSRPIREAFIQSLIWRDVRRFSDSTFKYINEQVLKDRDSMHDFLNVLLTVSSHPDHPLNAKKLHSYLMKFDMAIRDSWWSIYLHYQFGEKGAVDRLIDWALSTESKDHIVDDAIELCSTAIAWFLTSSNRFLRDNTTKALVALLTNRIHALENVLERFRHVNDPYVSERLYAVAYGCVMRSTDKKQIRQLAQKAYDWIFEDGNPPVHILLRDYARGIIEVALKRGEDLKVDVNRIRPPYKSEWIEDIPTKDELEKIGKQRGYSKIYSSVMGGDFSRYVIGTNTSSFDWLSLRLNGDGPRTNKEKYELFVQSLKDSQLEFWEKFLNIHEKLKHVMSELNEKRFFAALDMKKWVEAKEKHEEPEVLEEALKKEKESLLKQLKDSQVKLLECGVLDYLDSPNSEKWKYQFDLKIAERFIFNRTLELGWTNELFGNFDSNRYPSYQSSRKAERIGKKYQWIAYHEFLARVADNFVLDVDDGNDSEYVGPWQISYVRDIDPSCLLIGDDSEDDSSQWWVPCEYNNWESKENEQWVIDSSDLPSINKLIEVIDPKDGSKWLSLDCGYKWRQPTPPEEEKYGIPRREIWYRLHSFLVNKEEIKKLYEWAQGQDFWGNWMPDSHELLRVYLGEYYWSPAYEYHETPYFMHGGWTDEAIFRRLPVKVLVTMDHYYQEGNGYDCSVGDGVRIYLPAKQIAEQMGLSWKGEEGKFFDKLGNLIAFDPSVRSPGPNALLVNKDAFRKFLDEQGYEILWTVIGEKRIMGGDYSTGNEIRKSLELSGQYRMTETGLQGGYKTKVIG